MTTVTDDQSSTPTPEPQGEPQGEQPTIPPATAPGAEPRTVYVAAPPQKSRGMGPTIAAVALVGALAGGVVGGVAGAGVSTLLLRESVTQADAADGPSAVTINNPDDVTAVTAIAAHAGPSVVTIDVSGRTAAGAGSGVVLSADGYILTNTHVVTLEGATATGTIAVTTTDGRILSAEIVGLDPITDLAVIKASRVDDLIPIEWASSSDLNVGDRTVVIGAPLGLSNSVSQGIVSALNRGIRIASSAVPEDTSGSNEPPEFGFDINGAPQTSPARGMISIPVIQTDASINPGNSGGALVDGNGQLVGVIVAIASTGSSSTNGSIGVGFAIPSDLARRVSDELIENGTATHGLLGVMATNSTTEDGILGARISEVPAGGVGDAAGLRAGDVITAVGDIPVTSATDLTAQIRALAAGAETTITYVRAGQSTTVTVTLGALE